MFDLPEDGRERPAPEALPPNPPGSPLTQFQVCELLVVVHGLVSGFWQRLRSGKADKLAFPTLQQQTSPFQQLGAFVLVLGRKIDLAQSAKERWELF